MKTFDTFYTVQPVSQIRGIVTVGAHNQSSKQDDSQDDQSFMSALKKEEKKKAEEVAAFKASKPDYTYGYYDKAARIVYGIKLKS